MTFNLKSVLLLTAWIAWCIFATLSGQLWAYDTTELLGWLILSSTLALPFSSSADSRVFWAAYATTSAAFLFLVVTDNETVVRVSNTIAHKLVGLHIEVFGNGDGLSNAYLKTNIIGTILKLHCVPLLGIISAVGFTALVGASRSENAG